MEELKINLEDLEVNIEKYPSAYSSRLLEEFFILGYEDIIIHNKLLDIIKLSKVISLKKSTDSENNDNLIKVENFNISLSVLSVISSECEENDGTVEHVFLTPQEILTYYFVVPPSIYYKIISNKENEEDIIVNRYQELKIKRFILSNIQNETINIGYAFFFYEKIFEIINGTKVVIFVPKVFLILSQYPLFHFFDKLCKEIYDLYSSDKIEIPIEILIYNIINYIPAPVKNKLELDLFPQNSLEKIAKCNSINDYKSTDKFNLDQLSGYRHSEIYFGNIFNILPTKVIVETFLHLFYGSCIAIFSENQENLQLILYFFNQFIYPIVDNECTWGNSPYKFFCDSSSFAASSRVGFVCNYDDIKKYNPFNEKELFKNLINLEEYYEFKRVGSDASENLAIDFILDLKNGELKIVEIDDSIGNNNSIQENGENENEGEDKNNKNSKKYNKIFLYNMIKTFLDSPSDVSNYFEEKVLVLLTKLESYSKLHMKNNTISSLFNKNEERTKISKLIIEAFLQFNINICYFFLKNYSAYKGEIYSTKLEQKKLVSEDEISNFSKEENVFFTSFGKENSFHDILMNFMGGYSKTEPIFQKTVCRIYEYIISLISTYPINSKLFETHYISLFDSIYLQNNNEQKSLSFFEFFKYYNTNLKDFIFKNIDYSKMDCKIIKNNDNSHNYLYKYKKIDFDLNLLLSYISFLENVPSETKKLIFPLSDNGISIKEIIKSRDITNTFEEMFINCKIINFNDIVYTCILDLVVLSILNYKLIHFTTPVYVIFKKYNFFVRQYVELIISISFRYFMKEKQQNLFIIEKYFDIYKAAIKERGLFPNDELILLETNIDKFIKAIKEEREKNESDEKFYKEIKQENYEKIESIDENDLFNIDCDKKKIEEFEELKKKEDKFICNISFKTEYWINKEVKYDYIYYPVTIHSKLKKLINELYMNLNITNLNKDEYNKLVIDIIYYSRLIKNNMPAGIFKFLFYCLNDNK